ncbi:DUF5320 domain-containing protein [Rasiella rasia]|uniref:DUF5320 domain-containing protein n=1 Tax=Rasiella rasia TaxID=2744027 RepID=A0A6G6GJW0_9FLAO|nr:DUF5320 domain-containing protein [Rasiella rasia]QIE58804.1 DUF5320 domain-containing protein [Rasiella rasia]
MKNYILLLLTLLSITTLMAQNEIKKKYSIIPNAENVETLVLKSVTSMKTVYYVDGKEIKEDNVALQKIELLRLRCYAIYQNKALGDPSIVELRKKFIKRNELVDKLRNPNLDNNEKKVLKAQKDALENELEEVKCPESFGKIDGTIESKDGFLKLKPFKFSESTENTEGKNRLIKYFNGELKGYEKESIGLKLPENGQLFVPTTSFHVGALSLPLKLYVDSDSDSISGGTNNVRTDVDFALFVGKQWGVHGFNSKGELKTKKMQSANFLIGASKLTLNNKNTDGVIKKDTDVLSLDLGLAYGLSYNSFNILFGAGIDLPLSRFGDEWIFYGKPWVGIGVGYSIFSFE